MSFNDSNEGFATLIFKDTVDSEKHFIYRIDLSTGTTLTHYSIQVEQINALTNREKSTQILVSLNEAIEWEDRKWERVE